MPRAVCAVDAGTVVNPDLAAGQLEGGLCRGIGQALLEDTEYDPATGELTCGGMYIDYKLYTAEDMASVDDVKTFFATPTSRLDRSAPRGSARRPTTPWRRR